MRRYGQVIGFATTDIAPGEHVHVHNLAVGELEHDYAFCRDYAAVEVVAEADRRTFLGFRRADGRVGTRNYVAVLASVNCSSSACAAVVGEIERSGLLAAHPNVDGVIAFAHKGGCGSHIGSDALHLLQRTLGGVVHHPNVAGYVILSLGCEVNQPDDMVAHGGLEGDKPLVITIQEDGGFAKTVERGAEAVARLLPRADRARREPVPASELMLALQCGGSDSWSGVTANPGLGAAADLLVRQGGTVVLGETTEVYGGEHLLTRRARTPEVAQDLLDRIGWWEQYVAYWGASIDNNPTPGNKAGGLTTIYEKSLGAIAKAGSTPLNQVVAYGERVSERGFVHMDTPGYDPVSVTGQVAGGCNVVAFTTGRGSAFGFKPAPSIKIATYTRAVCAPGAGHGRRRRKGPRRREPGRAGQRDLRGDPRRRLGQADEERARRASAPKSSIPGSSARRCRGRISSGPWSASPTGPYRRGAGPALGPSSPRRTALRSWASASCSSASSDAIAARSSSR